MLSFLGAATPTPHPTLWYRQYLHDSNIGNILRMKTGIIYSIDVYQWRGGDSEGRERDLNIIEGD